jgi:hypothetical protein
MSAERSAAMVARVHELWTMGFTKQEVKPIVEAEFSHALTESEFAEVFRTAQQERRQYSFDISPVHAEYHQTLQRMQYVQGVLLNVFQSMQKNFQAAMEGRMEHDPDPDTGEVHPVIAVKPLELAAMGEKILKIDQDRVSAMLAYPRHVMAASAARISDGSSKPPQLGAITEQFVSGEELDDADL